MRTAVKIICAVLSALSVFSFGACSGKDNNKNNNNGYMIYEKKENVVSDEQYYKKEGVSFPAELWQKRESERYEEGDVGEVKAYFIPSVNGTYVFAYVGIPEGVDKDNPAPAVVLVHGGGGTAFYEWVRIWTARGYVAIAPDTEGNMPVSTSIMDNNDHQTSIKPHGPINPGFTDYNKPVEEQWAYNGIASVIVSRTFLSSMEEVKQDSVAITGVSYGAFLTCQAVGYDDRFAVAVPVYGSLGQKGSAGIWGSIMENDKTASLWDDVGVLEYSRTPILFLNGNTDRFFTPDSTTRSFDASRYANISLRTGMLHGHTVASDEGVEAYAFIDNVCKADTAGLSAFETQPTATTDTATLNVPKGVSLASAEVMWTRKDVLNEKTLWRSEPATIDGNKVSYGVPGDAKYFYVNVYDDRGFVVTSRLIANFSE